MARPESGTRHMNFAISRGTYLNKRQPFATQRAYKDHSNTPNERGKGQASARNNAHVFKALKISQHD